MKPAQHETDRSYPTAMDQFWMEPGSDIPSRIDPYTLLAIADYGKSKREATYRCICMRCGVLHTIPRPKLYYMAREQKKRAQKVGTLWPPFSGHCSQCAESQTPTLTGSRFTLEQLQAEDFSLLHCCRQHDDVYWARITILDPEGKPAQARPYKGSPWPITLEVTGPSSAVECPEEMLCRLLKKLAQAGVTTVHSHADKSVHLHAICLPSEVPYR